MGHDGFPTAFTYNKDELGSEELLKARERSANNDPLRDITTPLAEAVKALSPEERKEIDGTVFRDMNPGVLQFIEDVATSEQIGARIKQMLVMPVSDERRMLVEKIIADIRRASDS